GAGGHGGAERVVDRARQGAALRVDQHEVRAAIGTAHRLGVEAAVGRVVVLGGAALAHGERRHGGERPVVGHAPHDGEAGPAVGAVGERVAVAAVGLVEQFGQTVVTGGGVGRDQGLALAARPALDNGEAFLPHRRDFGGGDPL